MDALTSDCPLIVYIDIKSPYAFVAIEPTLRMEAELGLAFDWRPLTLDIPSYLGSARKKQGKVVEAKRSPAQWNSVRYAYRDARRYAELQGHMLKGTEKIWDTRRINTGMSWIMRHARGRLPAYLNHVYPAFWRRELDVEDMAVVEGCLDAAGAPMAGFAAWCDGEGRKAHDALQAQLHPAGIYGVPTYVFDGETLFGREHLPYIRWHLGGRTGAAPDIAYEVGPC